MKLGITAEAIFIGTDSLGFTKNQSYLITIQVYDWIPQLEKFTIEVVTKFIEESYKGLKQLRCEYSSMDLFLENWNIITLGIDQEHKNKDIKSILYEKMREFKINTIIS